MFCTGKINVYVWKDMRVSKGQQILIFGELLVLMSNIRISISDFNDKRDGYSHCTFVKASCL